jgi:beta-phosphoglucomutase-like phosphatase (HAD superfamily)
MAEILNGKGHKDAFIATPGLKEFLIKLKKAGIKIALVTSGLYEKAWPEIKSVFDTFNLGSAEDFYDAIITAGNQPGLGKPGTLGELEVKPHPWLYSEAAIVGLGVKDSERDRVIGIEDSSAGICSIRLSGFTAIGFAGGNIIESGSRELCNYYSDSFGSIYNYIVGDL